MQKPLKILVVRFSSIGDIVLTSPIVRCLKQQLSAEVHFITKNLYKTIVNNNPHIDKVYSINSSTNEVLNGLKNEKYDYLIDLHNNIRSFQLRTVADNYLSYNKQNFKKFLLVKFGIDMLNNKHTVDRYYDTVSSLGIKPDGVGLDFFLDEKDIVDIGIYNSEYISFAIGGTHFTKILPIGKIIEICNHQDKQVILVGGKEDFDRGERIAAQCDNVINTCGDFTLNQAAYIVKNSNFLITHDTGMMHIAAAFKMKIISVFGGTHPQLGFTPYLPNPNNKIIQIENLNCRPCHRYGKSKCPKNHFKCMKDIDVSLFRK
tara:strand:- start:20031 stop:20981 length:951 start_codon:yes stop_codon:yes gene_type:complete